MAATTRYGSDKSPSPIEFTPDILKLNAFPASDPSFESCYKKVVWPEVDIAMLT